MIRLTVLEYIKQFWQEFITLSQSYLTVFSHQSLTHLFTLLLDQNKQLSNQIDNQELLNIDWRYPDLPPICAQIWHTEEQTTNLNTIETRQPTFMLPPVVIENIQMKSQNNPPIRCTCDVYPNKLCRATSHDCLCYFNTRICQAIKHECCCHLNGPAFCQKSFDSHWCICQWYSHQCLASSHAYDLELSNPVVVSDFILNSTLCDQVTILEQDNNSWINNSVVKQNPPITTEVREKLPESLIIPNQLLQYCLIDCRNLTVAMVRAIQMFLQTNPGISGNIIVYCLHGKLSSDVIVYHIWEMNQINRQRFDLQFCVQKIVQQAKPKQIFHLVTNNRLKLKMPDSQSFQSINFWIAPHLLHRYPSISAHIKPYKGFGLYWSTPTALLNLSSSKISWPQRIILSIKKWCRSLKSSKNY